MCGIAGFIERRGPGFQPVRPARPRLAAMLRLLEHRGPDDWGMTFLGLQPDPHLGDGEHVHWESGGDACVALGHRRLSILDLTAAGRQPMRGPDGSQLVFNGEVYNYVELRRELAGTYPFRTRTDTEVLLAAYHRWGTDMLARLDGMFAFALWDARRGRLILARDIAGIKPCYYGADARRFAFASEPAAVLAGLETQGHADRARVAEFMLFGISDHDEGTCFAEVRSLPAGRWIEVDGDGAVVERRTFWQPPAPGTDKPSDPVATVRAAVERSVSRQLRADVPVGSCLSGGLDSGAVVATASRLTGDGSGFTTVTLTTPGFAGDESAAARSTAEASRVRWVPVEGRCETFAQDLDRFTRTLGEPFWSLSMYGQYRVMQAAREHGLKVMLDGQGGDEVFLGYTRVARRVSLEYCRSGQLLRGAHEWAAFRRNASDPWLHALLGPAYFTTPELALWRNTRRLGDLVPRALQQHVRPEVAADLFAPESVGRTQVKELTRYYLPALLRYEDRNSMAFGLEARVPLLSASVIETGLRLPVYWKVRDGWTKYALRLAMQDRLPPEIIWQRRKRSFEVHQRGWINAALPQIEERLRAVPSEVPLNPAAILQRLRTRDAAAPWLWRCVSVGLWLAATGAQW